MDIYDIWVDLAPGATDMELVNAVQNWLDHLQSHGGISTYRITRRKLGFGPEGLGEFHIAIEAESLAQLDEAFHHAATRSPEVESLHREVYTRVTNYKSGLWRDFPGNERNK
ncbi:hypothetical protein QPK87_32210 [Kamptonema cortianum]|nr:hypothetical protein [Geitlerinema splendidum]MDK3161187.1 hypothetical protein [Kamptonema cortianum]